MITRATLWATGHPRPCCWRSRRIGAASNEGRLQQTLLLREIAQSQTCSPQHLMSSESHFVTTDRFEFYSANSTPEITRSKNESFIFAHTRNFEILTTCPQRKWMHLSERGAINQRFTFKIVLYHRKETFTS